MTFEEASQLPRSEKVTLVTMLAESDAKLFDVYSGPIYMRNVENHVDLVKQDGDFLLRVYSVGTITAGTYYYSFTEKKIYFHLFGGVSPLSANVSIVYKFYFSNAPLVLPHDLASGEEIEWLPYVESIGSVGQTLDEENTGIVLESQSSVKLINNDGFFDDIFDTLLWENKTVSFYSWFPITLISEARKIFDGVVKDKDFESTTVTFNVKDFVYRLRNLVNLPLFTGSDGVLSPSLIDTPKRRIYGKVKQVALAGIDNLLEGRPVSGFFTIPSGSQSITGVGTFFFSELAPGDELIFIVRGEEVKVGIETVVSNTAATTNKTLEVSITSAIAKNNPLNPYTTSNRVWHIAGHKLREPVSTITQVISNNRFMVDSTEDIFAGDRILIDGDLISVRRISGNEIVTESAVSPLPMVNDLLTKLPVQNVYFGPKKLIYLRDWDYSNSTESKIIFNTLAEFNITQERLLGVSVTFTNGSQSITTTGITDFRSIVKSNDWIRKNSITSGQNNYYEIMEVKEQELIIRTSYPGSTETITAYVKIIDHIVDASLITCDCLGVEEDGAWVKTPSDVVRHLVLNDAEFDSVNEGTFLKAKQDCGFIVSMVIPDSIGGKQPSIRDTITKINESVFGSLYGDNTLNISYSILNSVKPESSEVITDADVISFSCSSDTEIYNNIKVNYRPFVDFFSGKDTFELINFNSGFVDRTSGIKATNERILYLYESDKAEIIAQRIALFRSMTSTRVTIKGKMSLFLNVVNDKIFVMFDRIYKRFGGADKLKIGIVTSIKRSQTETELVISDLGNIFNRVPSIAPTPTSSHSSSTPEERSRWGYVLDNQTKTPDPSSEIGLGNGIIG